MTFQGSLRLSPGVALWRSTNDLPNSPQLTRRRQRRWRAAGRTQLLAGRFRGPASQLLGASVFGYCGDRRLRLGLWLCRYSTGCDGDDGLAASQLRWPHPMTRPRSSPCRRPASPGTGAAAVRRCWVSPRPLGTLAASLSPWCGQGQGITKFSRRARQWDSTGWSPACGGVGGSAAGVSIPLPLARIPAGGPRRARRPGGAATRGQRLFSSRNLAVTRG